MLSETVYSSDTSDDPRNAGLSPRVAALATSFFDELQVLIEAFGQDAVHRLTPMIISVLENLDNAFSESHDYFIKLEEANEDKQQLLAQYQREKQLRKIAEEKYLTVEDTLEEDKRGLEIQLDEYRQQTQKLDNKCKTLLQQIERFEERHVDLRKENLSLKKHEFIHGFLEQANKRFSAEIRPRVYSLDNNVQSHTCSGSSSPKRSDSPPPSSDFVKSVKSSSSAINSNKEDDDSNKEEFFSNADEEEQQQEDVKVEIANGVDTAEPAVESSITNGSPIQIVKQDTVDEEVVKQEDEQQQHPVNEVSLADELAQQEAEASSDDAEQARNHLEEDDEEAENEEISDGETSKPNETVKRQESNVPEEGGERVIASDGTSSNVEVVLAYELEIDNQPIKEKKKLKSHNKRKPYKNIRRRPNLLAAPRGLQKIAATDESDTSEYHADQQYKSTKLSGRSLTHSFSLDNFTQSSLPEGLSDEIEHLVIENQELLEERDVLSTQKNDLSMRIEELETEKVQHQEELSTVLTAKTKLSNKFHDLVREMQRVKEDSLRSSTFEIDEEYEASIIEFGVTTTKKKVVTRDEIARVISERNQYKEKVIELQEILRWTEMIRATKESAIAATPRKKSQGVWKIFSGLFSSKKVTGPSQPEPAVIVEATQDHVLPQSSKKNIRHPNKLLTPENKPNSYDQYDSPSPTHSTGDILRLQKRLSDISLSCGWSRPAHTYVGKSSDSIDLSDDSSDTPRNLKVPIPVCCRPIIVTESRLKVWCGAVVNLAGYDQNVGCGNLSSLAWICVASHAMSKVIIIDANSPSEVLDSFTVCNSHVFGIVSVPAASPDDFRANTIQHSESVGDASLLEMEHGLASGGSEGQMHKSNSGIDFDSSKLKLRTVRLESGSPALPVESRDEADRKCSVMPTIWMGDQSGHIYVHSAVATWKRCLHSVRLPDSILCMVHVKGRVVVALSNGHLVIFHRNAAGYYWETTEYHVLKLARSNHSVRCMTVVADNIWCSYQNRVLVFDPSNMKLLSAFAVHPRKESQVRQMSCYEDGVWISIRLDSKLRLYHARTFECLQEIDIEPFVTQMLGTNNRNFSIVRITSILATSERLWVGTGSGVILIVPRSTRFDEITSSEGKGKLSNPITFLSENVLYCSLAHAQLSFHGHRDSVKFLLPLTTSVLNIWTEDSLKSATRSSRKHVVTGERTKTLIVTGGEGYIDFRLSASELSKLSTTKRTPTLLAKKSANSSNDRNHLLMWQI